MSHFVSKIHIYIKGHIIKLEWEVKLFERNVVTDRVIHRELKQMIKDGEFRNLSIDPFVVISTIAGVITIGEFAIGAASTGNCVRKMMKKGYTLKQAIKKCFGEKIKKLLGKD